MVDRIVYVFIVLAAFMVYVIFDLVKVPVRALERARTLARKEFAAAPDLPEAAK